MKQVIASSNISKKIIFFLLFAALVIIAGCTAGSGRFDPTNEAGFWMGLWHGAISVITFIISLFNKSVTVYEIHNSGGWYNFGFLLGIICVWGGGTGKTACHFRTPKEKEQEAEWKEVEKKVEAKLKRKVREWSESDEDEEWKEVGKKFEEKLKRKIKEWADEE